MFKSLRSLLVLRARVQVKATIMTNPGCTHCNNYFTKPTTDADRVPSNNTAGVVDSSCKVTTSFQTTTTDSDYNYPDTSSNSSGINGDLLLVKLLDSKGKVPTRGSPLAAGYDIYSSQNIVIGKSKRGVVSTGVAIKVPSGTYGRIAPRSGLTFKYGIDTGAGVIDEDYTGEIKVILFNHGDQDFVIKIGDRIAQLVLEKIMTPSTLVVDSLLPTDRGDGGFGSTGV